MAALLFPVYALMIALAPALVRDLLGPKWEGSASVIRILSLAALVSFFGDTVTALLKGYGNTHKVAVCLRLFNHL
jgi:O-antigen/teichoic acid export membrane protein